MWLVYIVHNGIQLEATNPFRDGLAYEVKEKYRFKRVEEGQK